MTRTPHDNFAKDYLEELLSPLGKVEISREVTDEARQIDVFFSPDPAAASSAQFIGLLGQLVTETSLIEVFRNQPSKSEIRTCSGKLYMYFAELTRQSRREDTRLQEEGLGWLWLLVPSASEDFLHGFGATLDLSKYSAGIFSFARDWRGSVVVINQLPVTHETLWLRILGKGKVQRQAVDELLELPDSNELRSVTLRLIANWRIITIKQPTLTEEDQEIMMNLSTAYVEWEQKTLEEGRQEGRQELIIRQLNRRIGEVQPKLIQQIRTLPIEQLELLGEALLDFSTVANLEQWLKSRPKPAES
jgi:hypothetical protein